MSNEKDHNKIYRVVYEAGDDRGKIFEKFEDE